MSKKSFWNADKVVSLCAILISIITIYISFKQHYASQEQFKIAQEEKKLSAMPYLSLTFESSLKRDNFGLLVANQGIGPAFIEALIIVEGENETEIDIVEYLFKSYPEDFNNFENLLNSRIYKGRMIPAGEKFHSFQINNSVEEAEKLQNIIYELSEKGVGLKIIYSSIYGDVWQLNVEDNIPEKLSDYETAL